MSNENNEEIKDDNDLNNNEVLDRDDVDNIEVEKVDDIEVDTSNKDKKIEDNEKKDNGSIIGDNNSYCSYVWGSNYIV